MNEEKYYFPQFTKEEFDKIIELLKLDLEEIKKLKGLVNNENNSEK